MTNHFLEGSTSENGFHLPRINSYSQSARSLSRVSSLGEMVDRYSREDRSNERQEERKKEFSYRNSKARRNSAYYNEDFNSHSANSFQNENLKAVYAPDINKVSMPIFGTRPPTSASTISVGSFKQNNLPSTPSQPKIDIEEYYNLLRDKVRINYHEIKTKFRNADPDAKGGVTKEALAHILAAVFGQSKPLGHSAFIKLLDRMDLKTKQYIRFDEFAACLQVNKTESAPEWVDPIRTQSSASSYKNSSMRRAGQLLAVLKERAQMRTNDIVELVGDGLKKIFKPELLNAIQGMHLKVDQDQFEKLWKKFDVENYGFVTGDAFLKRLGIQSDRAVENEFMSNSFDDISVDDSASQFGEGNNIPYANVNATYKLSSRKQSRGSSRSDINKKTNNPIEKWLKTRFRDGFSKIKASFEEIDRQRTGQVRRDQFLNVLNQHNFKLESNLLDAFLERCDIKVPGSQYNNTLLVSYTDFLERFQNRSDQGLAYRMIAHGDINDGKTNSTLGLVEGRLLKLFQNDFLSLLQVFRKIDRNKTNSLNKAEFRAAIESHFCIELTDQEFDEFFNELPLDHLNKVRYLEFMTRFDTDASSTLFDNKTVASNDFRPKRSKRREYEPIMEENEDVNPNGRSNAELTEILSKVVRNQYKQVEAAWNEVDVTNSNEMNKDLMFKLFKKIPIVPAITREEVVTLWKNFILKDNKRLAYWQFIRTFGYTKKSAAFLNSKHHPPTRGDNDMMLTSNKLGRDSILIRGGVQSKLFLLFDVLKRSFQDVDPHFTNFLLKEEFEEILTEICPELNEQEMQYIYSKHTHQSNGKINYVEFLAPYSPLKSREKHDDLLVKLNENGESSSRIDMSDPVIKKVKSCLSDRFKTLRMLFKQNDPKQSGYINAKLFKETLGQAKCDLDSDEAYTLLRILDKDITGMINYNRFINEIVKR